MLCIASLQTLPVQAPGGGAQYIGHQQVLQPHHYQALSHSPLLDREGGKLQITSTQGLL